MAFNGQIGFAKWCEACASNYRQRALGTLRCAAILFPRFAHRSKGENKMGFWLLSTAGRWGWMLGSAGVEGGKNWCKHWNWMLYLCWEKWCLNNIKFGESRRKSLQVRYDGIMKISENIVCVCLFVSLFFFFLKELKKNIWKKNNINLKIVQRIKK